MNKEPNQYGILFEDGQLGSFPMHRLKHVDEPTTLITDDWQRVDARESAYTYAKRGYYGSVVQRELPRFAAKYPLAAAQHDILFHICCFKGCQIAANQAPIPENPKVLSRHIKRLGYFLKADVMGICELPKSALYSYDLLGNPVDLDYKYAIVIVVAKEYQTINASTGYDWICDPISFQSYQRAGLIAQTIAEYIRKLGYPALAQHPPIEAGRYQVVIPPLLIWAGIGELSRAGIILNPFLGLGFKASAVLTDLPLLPDKPIDFGLQDFCRDCRVCAQECPSNAIPMGDKVIYNGYETWKLNERRCASFSITNNKGTICNRCVKVCPWTRPATWPHNLVRWGVQHSSIVRKFAIITDRLLGHAKANKKTKWWFDLEDVDGVLKIPSNNGTKVIRDSIEIP
ncbi:MAG: reductive dehalogenase [Chloroflexi bacterium]|nr:reductive dehalogenase [Chloroflexota bacterium]